ncbi:hypothetical protein EJ06DRAFT_531285 [Trichodelitschia bisporula]|uniref:Uncharacterized protein n=1 Tax=Trichodelitschia bisporula TaxID=703511 RepID=A0A6G1HSY6_9PEZI|nr:hypothetical protein EJ06DRAFT_531285 [Trichodelitschia bisporula]
MHNLKCVISTRCPTSKASKLNVASVARSREAVFALGWPNKHLSIIHLHPNSSIITNLYNIKLEVSIISHNIHAQTSPRTPTLPRADPKPPTTPRSYQNVPRNPIKIAGPVRETNIHLHNPHSPASTSHPDTEMKTVSDPDPEPCRQKKHQDGRADA